MTSSFGRDAKKGAQRSSFSQDAIERVAKSYQARIEKAKATTSAEENRAWLETTREFPDLNNNNTSGEQKLKLRSDVEAFIRRQKRIEKESGKEISEEKKVKIEKPQITEIKNSQPEIPPKTWGIEKGLPAEPEEDAEPRNIIHHEPQLKTTEENAAHLQKEITQETAPDPKSFLENESEIKYISKKSLREQLDAEHLKDIAERKAIAKTMQPKMR